MKLKFLFSLVLGSGALVASAQGYQDGVDNYNAGRYDVAKVILENNLSNPQTNKAVSYFYLGCIDFKENNLASAKANFEKGIQANPEYGYNYIGLGEIDLKNGAKKLAETNFKKGLACDKKNTALMAEVARAYYNVDPVKYKKEIDSYIAKAEKESKFSESAVMLLQGDMKASQNPGDAARLYQQAIEMDKKKGIVNREAYVKYGNTYFRVQPKYAIEKLEELYNLEKNSGLAQRELAEKYYDNQQYGRAVKIYGEYLQNPNHFQKDEQRYAGLLFSAGEYDQSLDIAKKILEKDPNNAYMHRMLLLNHNKLSNWDEAEAAGRVLFGQPDVDLIANDYIVFGNVLISNGKGAEAVEIMEKAVEMNPDQPDLLKNLSEAYEKAGMSDKAVEAYKTYLDNGNGSTNDLVEMGRRYAGLARQSEKGSAERKAATQEGLKYYNMALERVPDNGLLYNYIAQIQFVGNDDLPNADMVASYEKMLDLFNQDPANRQKYANLYGAADYLLGIYYSDKDNPQRNVNKARQYFNDYLELNPDNETVKQLLDLLN